MKNKKSLLILGLVVLVLVLGVGYAVVSSVGLTIGGTANVAESELKVSFEGTTEASDDDKATATAVKGSTNATIAVTNLTLNETVYVDYTVQNEEVDLDAEVIKASITNDKEEFFEVTTDIDSTSKVVSAGGTTTIRVSVKLIKTPVEDEDSEANITVQITATPKQS